MNYKKPIDPRVRVSFEVHKKLVEKAKKEKTTIIKLVDKKLREIK